MSYPFDAARGWTRLPFRFPRGRAGRLYSHTLRAASGREVRRYDAQVEEILADLARGKLAPSPDANPATIKAYLLSGGKAAVTPLVLRGERAPARRQR